MAGHGEARREGGSGKRHRRQWPVTVQMGQPQQDSWALLRTLSMLSPHTVGERPFRVHPDEQKLTNLHVGVRAAPSFSAKPGAGGWGRSAPNLQTGGCYSARGRSSPAPERPGGDFEAHF